MLNELSTLLLRFVGGIPGARRLSTAHSRSTSWATRTTVSVGYGPGSLFRCLTHLFGIKLPRGAALAEHRVQCCTRAIARNAAQCFGFASRSVLMAGAFAATRITSERVPPCRFPCFADRAEPPGHAIVATIHGERDNRVGINGRVPTILQGNARRVGGSSYYVLAQPFHRVVGLDSARVLCVPSASVRQCVATSTSWTLRAENGFAIFANSHCLQLCERGRSRPRRALSPPWLARRRTGVVRLSHPLPVYAFILRRRRAGWGSPSGARSFQDNGKDTQGGFDLSSRWLDDVVGQTRPARPCRYPVLRVSRSPANFSTQRCCQVTDVRAKKQIQILKVACITPFARLSAFRNVRTARSCGRLSEDT